MMTLLFVAIGLFCTLVQCTFWGLIFNRLNQTNAHPSGKVRPVSLILCARNARGDLEERLEAFLKQSHPVFEVIVVDDGSTDGTDVFLKELQIRYSNLRPMIITKTRGGKKNALWHGIQAAQYDWILLTDSDCSPSGPDWISHRMRNIPETADFVLGYAAYERRPGLLNRLMRFEACFNAIQMFSAASLGKAYAAVGRNLLVKKSMYEKPEVLRMEMDFGDDDLLLQYHRKSKEVIYTLEPLSFTFSRPNEKYSIYFNRRRRHYAASRYYDAESLFYLFCYYFTWGGWLFISILLTFTFAWHFGCLFLMIRWAMSWLVFCKQAKRFSENDLCKFFPFYELLYGLHLTAQAPWWLVKIKHWKHG